MEARLGALVAQPRFYAVLSGLFGALGMLLSMVGLYGVISHMVGQQTPEIAIRTALGAQRHDTLKRVVGHGFALTLMGLTIGLAGAFALSRLLTSLLFTVTATDPTIYLSASLLLLATTLVASYLPARRATRVDPILTLKCE